MAAVTKFSYLKEFVEPKVKMSIDGLPCTTEGYQRAKDILKSGEIVNAYVHNPMALRSSHTKGIHEFCEKLFNVQSLDTFGKLKETSLYLRMSIDKLQGIRGCPVRMDGNWREEDFSKFVETLRQWTERNPIPAESLPIEKPT